jgi:hypothetical protein
MQNKPCGLLSDSERSAYFVATDSIAAVYEHPKRGKPLVQRDRGILKDGPELHRELFVAVFTLPAALRLEVIMLFVAARGALGAIRPA